MTDGTAYRKRGGKRIIRQALIATAIAIFVGLAFSWHVAGRLVAPNSRVIGDAPPDLHAEIVQIPSDSGSLLAGWYLPQSEPKGSVLLLHGIRGSRLPMLDRARLLAKEGYSVLLIDFQAHGESPGEHITVGYKERHDALAAIDFLRHRQPDQPIGVIGASMGGAAAILARPNDIDALVLESVYPSLTEAVGNRVRSRVGILEPIATWLLLSQLQLRLGISPDDLRPIDVLPEIHCPVLVMSGAEDKFTPLSETQRLFDCASAPKELEIFPGAGHGDLLKGDPDRYHGRLIRFLDKYLVQDSPNPP